MFGILIFELFGDDLMRGIQVEDEVDNVAWFKELKGIESREEE